MSEGVDDGLLVAPGVELGELPFLSAMTITLISHNTYWFQGAPSLWGQERTQAHPRVLHALAALYRRLAPDVLCLQEVPSNDVATRLARDLNMQVAFAQGGARTQYGGAVLWRGFEADAEDLTRAGGGTAFERMCLGLRGAGPEGLNIVNVHLSSNRFAPDGEGDRVRLAELAALFASCPAPDIVVGDFNATPGGTVYTSMATRGFVECGTQACREVVPKKRRVDYVWIRSATRLETEPLLFEPSGFELDADSGIQLSDHPPVAVHLTSTVLGDSP